MMSSKSFTACPGHVLAHGQVSPGLCTASPSRKLAPTLPTVHLYYTPGLIASKLSMTSPCSDILKAVRNSHIKSFQVQIQTAEHR